MRRSPRHGKRLPSGRSAGTTPQSRLPSSAGPKPTSPNAPAGKVADRNLVSASISPIGWATSSASPHPAPSPSPPPATPSCLGGRGSGIRCPGAMHSRRGRRRVIRTGRHVPAGGWPGRMVVDRSGRAEAASTPGLGGRCGGQVGCSAAARRCGPIRGAVAAPAERCRERELLGCGTDRARTRGVALACRRAQQRRDRRHPAGQSPNRGYPCVPHPAQARC